jgi:predicted nucleic acid-binding protein
LSGLPEVELTTAIATRAGEIEGRAQAADENDSGVSIVDAAIAATALEYDEAVMTRDEKDFVRRLQDGIGLDALRVELYTSD